MQLMMALRWMRGNVVVMWWAGVTLPYRAVFCVNIILGNISLRWIPVSFMQTVKSLVPAFTVLLQTLLLKQYSSRLTYLSLVPVVGGVALASFTEVNFEFIGFMAALIASLTTSMSCSLPHWPQYHSNLKCIGCLSYVVYFVGVQSIVSSMLLTGALKLDSINLLYYMAPVSFVSNTQGLSIFEL